jgi:hypothetical protein
MIKCDHCGFGFYKTCPTVGCPFMSKPERVANGGPGWTPRRDDRAAEPVAQANEVCKPQTAKP